MAETFTLAGCGGRARQAGGVALFSAGAVGAAALLGAILGSVGALLPVRWAFGGAATLALLGALREAGIARLPLPQRRRQVPERWRRERPLAVWSTGYGAILGSGLGTFQPVATLWVVCAGALALASTATSAACLGAFGLGRALALVAARGDPLRRLARVHPLIRPANAAALAACAAVLAPGAARGATPPPPQPSGQSDPSVSQQVIAFTDQRGGVHNVALLERGAAPVVFPNARMPALSTKGLAYVDNVGIHVVLWRTRQEVLLVPGRVDKPALSGPRLAYVEMLPGGRKRLVVRDITAGRPRVVAVVGPGVDLGRPALNGRFIAWHEAGGDRNRIFLRNLRTGRTVLVAAGFRTRLQVSPALGAGHIAWVESRAEQSSVLLRRITGGRVRRVASTRGPRFHLWNTSIEAGGVYVTRWSLQSNRAVILRYRWAR